MNNEFLKTSRRSQFTRRIALAGRPICTRWSHFFSLSSQSLSSSVLLFLCLNLLYLIFSRRYPKLLLR